MGWILFNKTPNIIAFIDFSLDKKMKNSRLMHDLLSFYFENMKKLKNKMKNLIIMLS